MSAAPAAMGQICIVESIHFKGAPGSSFPLIVTSCRAILPNATVTVVRGPNPNRPGCLWSTTLTKLVIRSWRHSASQIQTPVGGSREFLKCSRCAWLKVFVCLSPMQKSRTATNRTSQATRSRRCSSQSVTVSPDISGTRTGCAKVSSSLNHSLLQLWHTVLVAMSMRLLWNSRTGVAPVLSRRFANNRNRGPLRRRKNSEIQPGTRCSLVNRSCVGPQKMQTRAGRHRPRIRLTNVRSFNWCSLRILGTAHSKFSGATVRP